MRFCSFERGVERHARALEHDQRQMRGVERVEGGGQIARLEIDPLDRVVGGEVALVEMLDALRSAYFIEARLQILLGKQRLVIAEAHQQKLLAGETRARAFP